MATLRPLHLRIAAIGALAILPALVAIAIESDHDLQSARERTRERARALLTLARVRLEQQPLAAARQRPPTTADLPAIAGLAAILLVCGVLVGVRRRSSDRRLIDPARRQAEELEETARGLGRSQAMLEALVEGTPDAICVKDREGRYLLANRTTTRLLDKTAAEILGRDDAEHLTPTVAREIMETDREIMRSGQPRTFKERVLTPAGRQTFYTTKAPFRDPDGTIGGIVGISRDIAEEESLRERAKVAHGELALLLEQLGEGLVGFDAVWRYTLVNASAAAMLRHAPEQLLGRTIWEVFPSAERGAEGVLLREAMATGQPRASEVPSVLGGWYQVRAFPSGDGLLVFFTDTSEFHRTRDALRVGMEQARALFNATPLAILGVDLAGRVAEWEGAAERMFGWRREEALGQPLAVLFPGFGPEVDQTQSRVLAGRSFTGLETTRPRRDGVLVPVSISAAPVRDAKQEITGLVMTCEDITVRRQAEAWREEFTTRLRALNARIEAAREDERRRIARELHDELGAILTALKMDVVALERGGYTARESTDPATRLAGMREQLDQTVRSIRRIATQLRPPLLDELGLVPAIEWLVGDFVQRTGIVTEFHGEAEQPPLSSDQSTALFRVAQEALTNIARHAFASHAFLTLEQTGTDLRLIVEDDGRGLPEREPSSLGILGMRERAELLGGTLVLDRRTEGGTRLILSLPLGATP